MSFSEATFAWRKRLLVITGLVILVVSGLILINYIFIGSYGKYVFTNLERLTTVVGSQKLVGIVLGGGIEDGQPKPLLKDRLDTAAYLLQKGAVRKLLLSGDNRISSYDEPGVMKNYLV